jgi:RimJ/RimL family protein N-acetyltransferase
METERLILRPWNKEDAFALYEIAKEEEVARPCGWIAHTSVLESLACIQTIYTSPLCFAITLKDGTIIGAIELKETNRKDEKEIGYFIGKDFWGHGYMPEAVKFLSDYAFNDLHINVLKICYYEGNDRSKRVAEKCGFHYLTNKIVYLENYHERRLSHVMIKNKED